MCLCVYRYLCVNSLEAGTLERVSSLELDHVVVVVVSIVVGPVMVTFEVVAIVCTYTRSHGVLHLGATHPIRQYFWTLRPWSSS